MSSVLRSRPDDALGHMFQRRAAHKSFWSQLPSRRGASARLKEQARDSDCSGEPRKDPRRKLTSYVLSGTIEHEPSVPAGSPGSTDRARALGSDYRIRDLPIAHSERPGAVLRQNRRASLRMVGLMLCNADDELQAGEERGPNGRFPGRGRSPLCGGRDSPYATSARPVAGLAQQGGIGPVN